MHCPSCDSIDIAKKGWVKRRKNSNKIRQYRCCDCGRRFTLNSLKDTCRQKRPDLNYKVFQLYIEGNTLRGISRILKCSYTTVLRKFRFMAKRAEKAHMEVLKNGRNYKIIQFDEIESFEIERHRTLGIELAVDQDSLNIVCARVARIPPKNNSIIPKDVREAYNRLTNRVIVMDEMMTDIKRMLHPHGELKSDGAAINKSVVKRILPKKEHVVIHGEYHRMWALNHIAAKMRHHISRLKRKTWATSKKAEALQEHLYLFIAYQNGYIIF